MSTNKLEVTTPGDREIVLKRVFNAPRKLVFEAMTKPEFVKRWLTGPPGWSMVVCTIDLRVGGTYRYEWAHENGSTMGMGGEYREVVRPERIVSTEKFDEAWYAGDAIGTLVLTENAGQTTITTTVLYDSKETRDGVLKSGMESGVAYSYDQLDEILASTPAEAAR